MILKLQPSAFCDSVGLKIEDSTAVTGFNCLSTIAGNGMNSCWPTPFGGYCVGDDLILIMNKVVVKVKGDDYPEVWFDVETM